MWFSFNAALEQWQDIEVPQALLITGKPQWRVWRAFDHGGVRAGRFSSTPGRWKWGMNVSEYFLIREGKMVIHPINGNPIVLVKGDSMVIEPGFEGEVEVTEDLIQEFYVKV